MSGAVANERIAAPPGPRAAIGAMMMLTWRRTWRDRSIWLSVFLMLLPIAFIGAMSSRWEPDVAWRRVVNVVIVPMFVALPPLNLAALIAEEIKEKTYSYLWSRPIPRWSIIAGKSGALIPFVISLFAVSATVCWLIVFRGAEVEVLMRAMFAIVLGVLATGSLSATVGVFLPAQAVPASAAYLLAIDLPVGAMPLSISNLSMTHHIRALMGTGGADDSTLAAAIWLATFTAITVSLSLWRIRRIQPLG